MVRITRKQALAMGVPKEELPSAREAGEEGGSKYRSTRTYDEEYGIWFDSAKEQRRFHELKLAERAGYVRNLRRQVPYSLDVNGEHVCNYFADFVYEEQSMSDERVWVEVVEDVKSVATRRIERYVMKKKLMWAVHHIRIREY